MLVDDVGCWCCAGTGAFINLPTRQRKSNYDVNEYYRARMQDKNMPGVRKRKVRPGGGTLVTERPVTTPK